MLRQTRALSVVPGLLTLSTLLAAQTAIPHGGRPAGRGAQSAGKVEIETIDFDEFPAGRVVSELTTSLGSGPIRVSAFNPYLPAGANAALVFDSARPTGGDFDLGTPHASFGGPGVGAGGASGPYQNDEPKRKLLIVAENLVDWNDDGLVDSPDD